MTQTYNTYDIGKPYTVTAHHVNHLSHNRMHKDGLPQKLGFRGAFVLGVANYGNMTRARVARLGEAWLNRAVIHRMLRGDPVHIVTVPVQMWEKKDNHWLTIYCAVRANNELCAEVYHPQIIKLRGA